MRRRSGLLRILNAKNMSKFYMRLLSVCLAALVLAACSSSEGGGDDGPTAGQIPDKAGMTVKGIVKDSAGNGIAGVVVSDGLEVTATDERGFTIWPPTSRGAISSLSPCLPTARFPPRRAVRGSTAKSTANRPSTGPILR